MIFARLSATWGLWMAWLAHWLSQRYLANSIDPHNCVTRQVWYPYVVQQVRLEATKRRQDGAERRANVVRNVQIRFLQKGLDLPPLHEIHLAIECAVKDMRH